MSGLVIQELGFQMRFWTWKQEQILDKKIFENSEKEMLRYKSRIKNVEQRRCKML